MAEKGLRTQAAHEILDREFLQMRATILDLAAALDRLDRATSAVGSDSDPRWRQLREALPLLSLDGAGRAERVQLMFSLPYQPSWQTDFGLVRSKD